MKLLNYLLGFLFCLIQFTGLCQENTNRQLKKTVGNQPNNLTREILLQAGPMVGYSEMKEVGLWVQTKKSATVHFQYKDDSAKTWFTTESVKTSPAYQYSAKIIADKVLPGHKYHYKLIINGTEIHESKDYHFQTQSLWQWRTDPPAFKFATGSCNYVNEPAYDRPGKPYGSGHEIFTSIYNTNPDFFLWLGDNTYLREADWNSKTGILHRYSHTRALPEMQPLLASCHHYAVWDDHDFGPNDSDRGFANKKLTEDVFNNFWVNPNTNLTGKGGITSKFQWADCDFYLLDDRYFRAPDNENNPKKDYLGPDQVQWLLDNLISSKAPFKFVCIGNQVLNPTENEPENYFSYKAEHDNLINAITEAKIQGVIFLTGDRHHTELCKLERKGTYPLYDLTCSALTSGVHEGKPNPLQVSGTLYNDHNFGLLEVSGKRKERQLKITILDKDGKEVWNRVIKQDELK